MTIQSEKLSKTLEAERIQQEIRHIAILAAIATLRQEPWYVCAGEALMSARPNSKLANALVKILTQAEQTAVDRTANVVKPSAL